MKGKNHGWGVMCLRFNEVVCYITKKTVMVVMREHGAVVAEKELNG